MTDYYETKSQPIIKLMVWQAYKKLKSNKGSAGIDQMGWEDLDKDLSKHLYKLWNRLTSGSYFPSPVKQVEIPKKDGGVRKLGVPTLLDRIAQQVVRQHLERQLEPIFHESSFGYRPGRNAHQAKLKCFLCFTLGKLYYLYIVDKNQKHRKITFFKNYFQEFFDKQNKKVKAKIIWTFELVEDLQRVPETYLKHIENSDGLYEIRVQLGSDIFRIFCFFDLGRLVVLANGFQKKTQKTPTQEIEMALKIKAEYENEK